MNLEALLAARLRPVCAPADPAVRRSPHADYQSAAALVLARTLDRPARDVAADVVARADLAGLATAEVSGPGFVNLTVTGDALAAAVEEIAADDRLGVPPVTRKQTVLVDYSGPNAAKELTIGHLRSTVIGDAAVRLLEWLGHDVVRVNHLGDWGTSFGMIIEHLIGSGAAPREFGAAELSTAYRAARVAFDADPDFRDRARRRVVLLQTGDAPTRAWWRRLVAGSRRDFLVAYRRLGVTLTEGDFAGESSYQDQLADVVAELTAKGLLTSSDGALCAFPPGFTARDGGPLPLIVRKSDGGYGYATTDLAALRHRALDLRVDRLLYVVGAPQRTHFAMVFAVAEAAGWLTGGRRAEHVAFGSILGPDGRMFRSRSGEAVTLAAVLDEADARTSAPEVGVGALKYADLSSDRRGDYVFDWDRMLALTGNTGPYLQYAHARIRSLLDRAGGFTPGVTITEPAERELALALLAFEPVVTGVAESLEFHRLAGYLHDLAAAFSAFYERCPVLRAAPAVRDTRLTLCRATGRTLRQGLDLLGIATPDRL
ncbi:arginine--tRNA ligase [Actinoplanes sp. N902-109]|uniref:arginine--tRNA ligase n=1 Tax=Actinoplanes sp. (strain N902-109) TaxID=649831 RepID=UPI0003295CD5|nr:arginine--tRNA ligase [Actinoplanes sp. N902-109]AGL15231.1 arginyl-tRNA synthetase [Actinoplanes sp. N902-109]